MTRGIAWIATADVIVQVFRLGSTMILARLLIPEHFGIMAMAMVIIKFGNRAAFLGLGSFIVREKNLRPSHVHTTFNANLLLYSFISLLIWVFSPLLVSLFNEPKLFPIIPIMVISFFLKSQIAIPVSLLKREMQFNKVAQIAIISSLSSMTVAIVLAFLGMGLWSLVYAQLTEAVIIFALNFILAKYIPRPVFKISEFKEALSFGFGYTVNNYLYYLIDNVDYFLIGKFLGAQALGFYERAFNLMTFAKKKLERNVGSVLFSSYSKIQDDNKEIVRILNKTVMSVALLIYPAMIWAFFAAPAIIRFFLGNQWDPTVRPFQIMCISGLIFSFNSLFNPIIGAKAALYKWAGVQAIQLISLAILLIILMQAFGVNGAAMAVAGASMIYFAMLMRMLKKVIGYGFVDFVTAHRSIILIAIGQIVLLATLQLLTQGYLKPESVIWLALTGLLSLSVHFLIHFYRKGEEYDLVKKMVIVPISKKIANYVK